MEQLIDPIEACNSCSKTAGGKIWAKRPFRLSMVYYLGIEGLLGRTIKFVSSLYEGTCNSPKFRDLLQAMDLLLCSLS
jgi:hypothetical protein